MVSPRAVIELLRPVNCLMLGLAVIVGEFVAYRTVFPFPTFLGFMTGFLLGGASMVSNDYLDRNVDAINAPGRPIPSGRVSSNEAIGLTFILSSGGLAMAYLLNVFCFMIAVLGFLLFLLYNYRGKQLGLVGNMMVSMGMVFSLVYGGFVGEAPASFPSQPQRLALFLLFGSMVFLSNTGREVNKGIADVVGDRLRGVKTVALKRGAKVAALVSAMFYSFAVVVSFVPWFLGLVSWLYFPLVVVADLGFEASAFILLRDHSKGNALKVKRMVLLWMLLGLLAFVAGAL
jgi:geranylgeranylglycerol-phosphate geranylgeranyltransferase